MRPYGQFLTRNVIFEVPGRNSSIQIGSFLKAYPIYKILILFLVFLLFHWMGFAGCLLSAPDGKKRKTCRWWICRGIIGGYVGICEGIWGMFLEVNLKE